MSETPKPAVNAYAKAVIVNVALVAAMWVLEIFDVISNHALDSYGILPRSLEHLFGVLTAPWLHFGWAHLASNSIPFIVLGSIILISGLRTYLMTLGITIVVSGMTVWFISPSYSMTLGASGVVFGFLTYVLVRGLFTKKLSQIVLAIVIFAFYGGILWGVLPINFGVSWQAHLGGAIGGVLAAWLIHARPAGIVQSDTRQRV